MAVETFKKFLRDNNFEYEVLETADTTHTAQQAADTHKIPVCNIVKSLLVKVDDNFILYLVPGDKRLDLEWVKNIIGVKDVRMANADEVKDITGYSIGGVPPFGHKSQLQKVIIDGFCVDEMLVAAAGSQKAVFRISLKDLYKLTR
jgi:prolyl-tRNA editing enzyme YbaK/EbsC (Cys-tRNA(Pro) deacylase)